MVGGFFVLGPAAHQKKEPPIVMSRCPGHLLLSSSWWGSGPSCFARASAATRVAVAAPRPRWWQRHAPANRPGCAKTTSPSQLVLLRRAVLVRPPGAAAIAVVATGCSPPPDPPRPARAIALGLEWPPPAGASAWWATWRVAVFWGGGDEAYCCYHTPKQGRPPPVFLPGASVAACPRCRCLGAAAAGLVLGPWVCPVCATWQYLRVRKRFRRTRMPCGK